MRPNSIDWKYEFALQRLKITEDGRVFYREGSYTAGRQIKQWKTPSGYYRVNPCFGGVVYRHLLVHRLVAMAWLPNDDPARKTVVNHLNEDPGDNRACNLAWATNSENLTYGSCHRKMSQKRLQIKRPRRRSVVEVDDKGNVVGSWDSIAEAGRQTGITHTMIYNVCSGKHFRAAGRLFRYV